MTIKLTPEETHKLLLLRRSVFSRLTGLNDNPERRIKGLSSQVELDFLDDLEWVLKLASKFNVSTNAIGRMIAFQTIGEENRDAEIDLLGTLWELEIMAGHPIRENWTRVPRRHLSSKYGPTITRWLKEKADIIRRIKQGVYEVRPDAITQLVNEAYIDLYIPRKVSSD